MSQFRRTPIKLEQDNWERFSLTTSSIFFKKAFYPCFLNMFFFPGRGIMFNALGIATNLAILQKILLPILVKIFISHSTNCSNVICLLYYCDVMGEICPNMPGDAPDKFIFSIFWRQKILLIYCFHCDVSNHILHSQIFWGAYISYIMCCLDK